MQGGLVLLALGGLLFDRAEHVSHSFGDVVMHALERILACLRLCGNLRLKDGARRFHGADKFFLELLILVQSRRHAPIYCFCELCNGVGQVRAHVLGEVLRMRTRFLADRCKLGIHRLNVRNVRHRGRCCVGR